jgi:hypothetical protein
MKTMTRISAFVLAATLAAGSLFTVTAAEARGGHFSGTHFSGSRFSAAPRFASPRFASPRFGARPFIGARPYAFRGPYRYNRGYPYLGYAGCYRWQRVWTSYGPRLIRVNACGYPYSYSSYYNY